MSHPTVNMCLESEDYDDKYHNYEKRLITFLNWTNPVNPEDLAHAGFYYTKRGDIVKCAFCQCEFHNWQTGDDPLEDHRRHARHCEFAEILWRCRHFNTECSSKHSLYLMFSLVLIISVFYQLITSINILQLKH